MAEVQISYIKCDFCTAQTLAATYHEEGFYKVGKFDLCPACFTNTFTPLTDGIGAVWPRLHKKGDGPHNGRAVDLITAMCKITLHEQVGDAVTEFKEAGPA